MPPDRTSMLGQLQQSARQRLMAAGIETPALDARLIIQHALGMTHEALIASPDRLVDHQQSRHIDVLLARRERREPVSRITGEREFYGRPFLITPDVLDPRPDTETLIDQVLDIARTGFETERPLRLLELGTGSGAIVVTLLAELVSASATATDVSDLALSVARHNAQQLVGLDRIDFVETSWFDGICGEYDVIASNPPYILTKAIAQLAPEVADYDPLLALDGGRDGLGAYRALVPPAFDRLTSGGFLSVEIGAEQADEVTEIMARAGFVFDSPVPVLKSDLAGLPRVVTGRKPNLY